MEIYRRWNELNFRVSKFWLTISEETRDIQFEKNWLLMAFQTSTQVAATEKKKLKDEKMFFI